MLQGFTGNVRELPSVLKRQASALEGTGTNPHNLALWEQRGAGREHELWISAASLLLEAAEKLEARIAANRPHRERIEKAPLKLKRERLAKPIVRERLGFNRGARK